MTINQNPPKVEIGCFLLGRLISSGFWSRKVAATHAVVENGSNSHSKSSKVKQLQRRAKIARKIVPTTQLVST